MTALRKFTAGLSAVLFVLTGLAALLLFNFERRAFNPDNYKQAMLDAGVYERAPALIGEVMVASANHDPCAANPIACQAEARSPEATACFESALGIEAYQSLAFGGRTPNEGELQQVAGCLAQFPPAPSSEGGPPPFRNLSYMNGRA
jgi:hypothetical protein